MSKVIKVSDAAGTATGMEESVDQLVTQQESDIAKQESQVPTTLSDKTSYELKGELSDEQQVIADNLAVRALYDEVIARLKKDNLDEGILAGTDWPDVARNARALDPISLQRQAQELGIDRIDVPMLATSNIGATRKNIFNQLDTYVTNLKQYQQNPRRQMGLGQRTVAFNLRKYKIAQQIPLFTPDEFIATYLDRLMGWSREKNARTADAVNAANEIIGFTDNETLGGNLRDALDAILQLEPEQRDEGANRLRIIFDQMLPPSMKKQAGRNTMDVPGIVKYNLSDHILDSKVAGMTKTAAAHQSQEYTLYGPTEKRICPKLRGKGGGYQGSGDVVSEYICRHHCLDGIVIDDNKTVCGEALWRANVMDKFSRDYVDEDGRPVGGYIEKRFEVNHNVPEENRMRLRPGETRRDRPVEQFGNLEARMQAMRKAEGKDRGYRPETDTGDTFNWTKDVDQNNVEVSQSERDRREKSMGHKLVQYTNKNKQENNPEAPPKKAFNLKQYKTAQSFTWMDQNTAPAYGAFSTIEQIAKEVIRGEGGTVRYQSYAQQIDAAFDKLHGVSDGSGELRPMNDPLLTQFRYLLQKAARGDNQAISELQSIAPEVIKTVDQMKKQANPGLQSQTLGPQAASNKRKVAHKDSGPMYGYEDEQGRDFSDLISDWHPGKVETNPDLIPDDGVADGGEPYTDDEMDLMDQGPQEDDVVCEDHNGPFFSGGKKIANSPEELKAWMQQNSFFPDVWFISDHGNPINVTKDFGQLDQSPMEAAPMEAKPMDAMSMPVMGFNLKKHKEANSKKKS